MKRMILMMVAAVLAVACGGGSKGSGGGAGEGAAGGKGPQDQPGVEGYPDGGTGCPPDVPMCPAYALANGAPQCEVVDTCCWYEGGACVHVCQACCRPQNGCTIQSSVCMLPEVVSACF